MSSVGYGGVESNAHPGVASPPASSSRPCGNDIRVAHTSRQRRNDTTAQGIALGTRPKQAIPALKGRNSAGNRARPCGDAITDPSLHILRDGCEVLQRCLQVLGDVLSDDMGRGQIRGFLKAFVLQPEDVEVHLVALC